MSFGILTGRWQDVAAHHQPTPAPPTAHSLRCTRMVRDAARWHDGPRRRGEHMSVLSYAASAVPPPLPFPAGATVWRCSNPTCHKPLGVVRGNTITIAYHYRITTITAPSQVAQKCKCGTVNTWPPA